MNPQLIDLVYFRDDPWPDETSDPNLGDTDNSIWDAYCANEKVVAKPPFCSAKKKGDHISHRGLGFRSGSAQPQTSSVSQACAPLVGGSAADGTDVPAALQMRTGINDLAPALNTQQFNEAVSLPSSSAGGIGMALRQLHLDETPDGEWLLTLGHRIVTGSSARLMTELAKPGATPQADVWPACASSCSDTGKWIGKVFAGPGDLRSTVERTLFYMGALAGGIPQGSLSIPLPVADRTPPVAHDLKLPSIALYSPGYFQKESDYYVIEPENSTGLLPYTGQNPWGQPAERAALGNAYVAPSTFAGTRQGVGPTWRRAAFTNAGNATGLKYVLATNDPISFDPALVTGRTEDEAGRQDLAEWLKDMGHLYSNNNDPSIPTVETPTFLQQVEEASFYTKGKLCNKGIFKHGRSVCAGAPGGAPTFFYYSPAWLPLTDTCE